MQSLIDDNRVDNHLRVKVNSTNKPSSKQLEHQILKHNSLTTKFSVSLKHNNENISNIMNQNPTHNTDLEIEIYTVKDDTPGQKVVQYPLPDSIFVFSSKPQVN